MPRPHRGRECALGNTGRDHGRDPDRIGPAGLVGRAGWQRAIRTLVRREYAACVVDGSLQVSVPSQFYQDWLRSHFRPHLEASCLEALGKKLDVTFHVDAQLARVSSAATTTVAAKLAPVKLAQPAAGAPQWASGATQPAAGSPCQAASRRRFASLEGFVVGSSNRIAGASARNVVERLGHVSPLMIHGPTGVGKTHLLEGIWSAARSHGIARLHAVYLSAEQFTSYFLEALRGSGLPNFRRKYRGVELLLIDDLQFFAGKRATLVELLHTIDTLPREGRQLVFAADRAPAESGRAGPRDRHAAGRRAGVSHRSARLRDAAGNRPPAWPRHGELPFRTDVQLGLRAHVNFRHARELAGACSTLHATSLALEQPITLAMAEEALAEIVATPTAVRLTDMQKAVCDVFGLEPASSAIEPQGQERGPSADAGHVAGREAHPRGAWRRSAISSAAAATAPSSPPRRRSAMDGRMTILKADQAGASRTPSVASTKSCSW